MQVLLHTTAKAAVRHKVRVQPVAGGPASIGVQPIPFLLDGPQITGEEEERIQDSATALKAGGSCQGKATWRNDTK